MPVFPSDKWSLMSSRQKPVHTVGHLRPSVVGVEAILPWRCQSRHGKDEPAEKLGWGGRKMGT
jgi:hypothetical protein